MDPKRGGGAQCWRRALAGGVLAALAGCGGAGGGAGGGRADLDVAPAAAPGAPDPAAGAELFAPGTISDARSQWRITFTPDGDTAYFAASDGFFPRTRQATIHRSHRVGDRWTPPEVAPFSGAFSDIDPAISPDGRRLFFSSIRPVDGAVRGDIDLWVVERAPGGWSDPIRLGPEINGPDDELYPSIDADGTLWFAVGPAAPRPDLDWNIVRAPARGAGFAPREPVPVLNTALPWDPANPTADWEFNPEISPDGRTLVFTSLRPGGHGYGDLYVSRLVDGAWSAPRNLGPPANTAADEFHPTWGRDGFLYFARNSGSGGDFWRVPAALAGVRR